MNILKFHLMLLLSAGCAVSDRSEVEGESTHVVPRIPGFSFLSQANTSLVLSPLTSDRFMRGKVTPSMHGAEGSQSMLASKGSPRGETHG